MWKVYDNDGRFRQRTELDERRVVFFSSAGTPRLSRKPAAVKHLRNDLGDSRVHPTLFRERRRDWAMPWVCQRPPFVTLYEGSKWLKEAQRRIGQIAKTGRIRRDDVEFLQLAIA